MLKMVKLRQLIPILATLVYLGQLILAEDPRCYESLLLVDFASCDTHQLRWSFNRDVKQCVQFLGCNRTSGNNFDKIDDCTSSCYVQTTPAPALNGAVTPIKPDASRCTLNLTVNDLTRCDTIQLRWSFDTFLKRCRQIAGCRRNAGNNFDSMDECDYHCKALITQGNQVKSCGAAPSVPDGTISRKSFSTETSSVGDFIVYTCNRGRKIDGGNGKIECHENGTWSILPKCIPEAPCGAPPEVPGATIKSQSYSSVKDIVVGDFVEYRCSKGMKMWGQSYIVCQPGGKWSPQPKCQDLASQNPQLRCTGRLSLADVSFCQLEVRYTFSTIQQRCLPFWGCPREQGNNFPTEEICKTSCEATNLMLAAGNTTTTTTTTTKPPVTSANRPLNQPDRQQQPGRGPPPRVPHPPRIQGCSRPRGPQCLPGVAASHTSCLDDGGSLIDLPCVNQSEILDRHNYWRSRVEPQAESMPQLRWDDALATTAERWAAQCPEGYGTGAARSLTSGSRQWPWIGQNICFASYDQPWTECVDDWASERERWIYGIGPFPADSVVGHYTQIVWADTLYVGCAKAQCAGSWSYVLVCNYGPGGNVKGVAAPNAWAYPYVSRQKN